MSLFNSGSAGATRPAPTTQEGGPMGLKEYSTVINGQATTLQLSDEDAKLQGFTSKDLVSKQEVEVTEAQREAETEDAQHAAAEKAKAAAANKQAPAPQNKAAAAKAQKADG